MTTPNQTSFPLTSTMKPSSVDGSWTFPSGEPDTRHHAVIIGSGFGGLFAAKALRRSVRVRITLVDRTNHHLFQPLLYQVATGILSEGQIAPPIRDVFRNYYSVHVVAGEVKEINPDEYTIGVNEFGSLRHISYDSLIVAGGVVTSYYGHDEYRKNALGMKSLNDALSLRHQIFGAFERAEVEEDDSRRAELLTFVVIGGGPTGVEMAGQLKELSRRALRRNFRRIDPESTRVVLVEGGDSLVASMGKRISRITAKDLAKSGVELRLRSMVTGMDEQGIEITQADGTSLRIDAATRVWAAGMEGSWLGAELAARTGVELDRLGRVRVEPDCSVPGYPDIFVVGDLMALNDLPGVAEVAMQSGAHAGHAIARRVKGDDSKRAFQYFDLGTMAAISRFRAVAKVGPIKIGGLPGWLLWLVVHVTFLTGFKNRVGAMARWAVSFIGRGRYERALMGDWANSSESP
jgi:NADH:ubiquinone reductase (H+-translocating)